MTKEEAIEIVKEFINGTCLHLVDQEAFETLIPELRESKDEKIKNSLIKYFNNYYEMYDKTCGEPKWGSDNLLIKDILTWLEKHREQKPTEWSFPYGENETVDNLIAIAECLEMDGDCLFSNEHTGMECGKFLRDLARKQVECKPIEWSKEDEVMSQTVLQDLANIKAAYPKVNIQPEFDWLKSLSLNLKKKNEDVAKLCSNEWNEEDKTNG